MAPNRKREKKKGKGGWDALTPMAHAGTVDELNSFQELRRHLEYGFWAELVVALMVVCKDLINGRAK